MRVLAYQCAKVRHETDPNQELPDSWKRDKMAGTGWYYGFMEKRPDLSLRKPEPLGRHRALMANDRVLTQ